ncbi:MAG: hypothetical protein M1825_004640 [Sarcosagium campestre]|nr:MAG: hypothetical protein M1825_004640 [Sarcosagium campestre]
MYLEPSTSTGQSISGLHERRSFHFFRTRTAPQMAGFFNSDFWNRLLLQASHHEPVIRYAVIALGSLHERFEREDMSIYSSNYDNVDGGFALDNYVKAIGHLINPLPNGKAQRTADVALIACVLFTSFETMRGHYGSALSHVDSGIKIITELNERDRLQDLSNRFLVPSQTPYVPLEILEMIFTRLDTQALQLVGFRDKTISQSFQCRKSTFASRIPEAFSSIEEARNSLDYHWNQGLHMFRLHEPNGLFSASDKEILEIVRLTSKDTLDKWSRALEGYVHRAGPELQNPKAQRAIQLLKMHERTLQVDLSIDVASKAANETHYDLFTPELDEVLSLAEAVIEKSIEPVDRYSSTRQTASFTLDAGIISPLFVIAGTCRDPRIRRKAIRLMRSSPRKEGVWDGMLAARVAERIVSLEEGGLGQVCSCRDVPEWARLSDVDVKFNAEGRRTFMTYSRRRSPNDYVRDRFEEWIID